MKSSLRHTGQTNFDIALDIAFEICLVMTYGNLNKLGLGLARGTPCNRSNIQTSPCRCATRRTYRTPLD